MGKVVMVTVIMTLAIVGIVMSVQTRTCLPWEKSAVLYGVIVLVSLERLFRELD